MLFRSPNSPIIRRTVSGLNGVQVPDKKITYYTGFQLTHCSQLYHVTSYQWFSTRLQYLHCFAAVLHSRYMMVCTGSVDALLPDKHGAISSTHDECHQWDPMTTSRRNFDENAEAQRNKLSMATRLYSMHVAHILVIQHGKRNTLPTFTLT